MKIKVLIGNMLNAKRIVNIMQNYNIDIDIVCGRYILSAKSMLGCLSLANTATGELVLHTDDREIYEEILSKLRENELLLENFKVDDDRYDISAMGELLIDFTIKNNKEGNTKLFEQNPGGAPANVLACASRLGSKTAFIGKVGSDMHGVFLKKTLDDENICTKGLLLDSNYFTTLAFVDLSESGERTFSFARKPGADTMIRKEEVDYEIIRNSKIFHVGSLSLTDSISREATFAALDYAKDSGIIISYDPNFRPSLWENTEVAKEHMRKVISYADVMKISDEEIQLMTDSEGYEEAAKKLCDKGVSIVVVTLGKEGAYVCTSKGGALVNGFTSKVVDTTGAGDAFWGAFLHKIASSEKRLSKLDIAEISGYARFANSAASICVEKRGAINSMPTLQYVFYRLLEV